MITELSNTIKAIVINNGGEYLQLFDLRNRLNSFDDINVTRAEVDAELVRLHLSGEIRLDPEEGFRFLAYNPEYAEAGVSIGDEMRHLISME